MKIIPRSFSGWTTLAYNAKTSIQLPTGPTYHELIFRTNLTAAQILWVNVKLGTDTIVRCKGTDLKMLELYRKVEVTQPGDGTGVTAVNEHVLNFADIANLGVESRNFTALVTSPGEQLYVELEIGAAGAGSPAIVMECDGEVSAHDPRGRRWLPKLLRGTFNATQTADNNFNGLTRGEHRYYRRVHFEALIDKVRISKDRVQIFERGAYRNTAHLKRNLRVPQANYYHLDFIASDFGRMDMLRANAKESLEIFFDIAAAANIEMLVESVDDLHPEWEQAA